jgi:hypothetical protein
VQPVPAPDCQRADRLFPRAVVDCQPPIAGVHDERGPLVRGVGDRLPDGVAPGTDPPVRTVSVLTSSQIALLAQHWWLRRLVPSRWRSGADQTDQKPRYSWLLAQPSVMFSCCCSLLPHRTTQAPWLLPFPQSQAREIAANVPLHRLACVVITVSDSDDAILHKRFSSPNQPVTGVIIGIRDCGTLAIVFLTTEDERTCPGGA